MSLGSNPELWEMEEFRQPTIPVDNRNQELDNTVIINGRLEVNFYNYFQIRITAILVSENLETDRKTDSSRIRTKIERSREKNLQSSKQLTYQSEFLIFSRI